MSYQICKFVTNNTTTGTGKSPSCIHRGFPSRMWGQPSVAGAPAHVVVRVCTAWPRQDGFGGRCALPDLQSDTYIIDVFVRTFMSNSYRLLASGRVIALPKDAGSITAVIRPLPEPCHVELYNIIERSFLDNFLSLTAVTSISYQPSDCEAPCKPKRRQSCI